MRERAAGAPPVPTSYRWYCARFSARTPTSDAERELTTGIGRVRDQHHREELRPGEAREHRLEPLELRPPDAARGMEDRRRDRGVHAHDRERAANAQRGELAASDLVPRGIGLDVLAPVRHAPLAGDVHVGVVVAGNDRDALRRAEGLEPLARGPDLLL